MQLRQAEAVGAVHDDGVGGGHVDAGLDDGGAQQQVEALVVEVAHHVFQFAFAQLAVGDADVRFRQHFFQPVAHEVDALHLVVQEIHLAAAFQFAHYRFPDHAFRPARHEGLDGKAFLRRGGDHRKFPQAFHRHRQRARNRRGGQRQHVHLGPHGLELFLLAHAETVFFVQDHQAQVLERDVLLDQAVGADDDVDLARCQVGKGLLLFLRASEA
ncbi:hypothetical protein GALL_438910 [mine drainage metagenome]|uniref:Uncharacterized protein n=1 Tax=mine drainage metagenome TaxID=410659 RepID=A0A1J5QEP1_9ZZZZ